MLQPKNAPTHKGTDPLLQEYRDEYLELASERNIVFNRDVTMGFTEIKPGALFSIIGVCYYGDKWREIDIDKKFFTETSYLRKKMLVFHEMTHCFCGRDHTYGSKASTMYPNGIFERIAEKLTSEKDDVELPEAERPYFDDGCPRSIMHPVITTSTCIFDHYDYYINEMFNQCRPW